MSIEDTPEYLRGRDGEKTVREWLRTEGWDVTNLCDIKNPDRIEAPMLMDAVPGKRTVLPDFEVVGKRRHFYVEVKTKTTAPQNFKLSKGSGLVVRVHGIGKRVWGHYISMTQKSGSSVYLLILEQDTEELLGLRLSGLNAVTGEPVFARPDDEYQGPSMDEPMVYFKKSRMPLIARLSRLPPHDLFPRPTTPLGF